MRSPANPVVCGGKVSGKVRVLHDYDSPLSLIKHFKLTFYQNHSSQVPCHPSPLPPHITPHFQMDITWESEGALDMVPTHYKILPRSKLPLTLSTSPRYYPTPEVTTAYGINASSEASSSSTSQQQKQVSIHDHKQGTSLLLVQLFLL